MKYDCLLALSYFTETESEAVKLLLEQLNIDTILSLIDCKNKNVIELTLRVLGNICSESTLGVQLLIKANGIERLKPLLTVSSFHEEICWILSNIAISGNSCLQELINSEIFGYLCHLVVTSKDHKVIKEAGWAICNACTSATTPQVKRMIEMGALAGIAKVLSNNDVGLKLIGLKVLYQILMCGKIESELNYLAGTFESAGGVQQLEDLRQGENETVSEITIYLLNLFYNKDIMVDYMIDE